jgi:hypothetical protein
MFDHLKNLATKSFKSIKLFFENDTEFDELNNHHLNRSNFYLSYDAHLYQYEKDHLISSMNIADIDKDFRSKIWSIDLIRVETHLHEMSLSQQQNIQKISDHSFLRWISEIQDQKLDDLLMGFWIKKTRNLEKDDLNVLKKFMKNVAQSIYHRDEIKIRLVLESKDQLSDADHWLQFILRLLPSQISWESSFHTYSELQNLNTEKFVKIKIIDDAQFKQIQKNHPHLENYLILDLSTLKVKKSNINKIKTNEYIDLLVNCFLERKKYCFMLRDLKGLDLKEPLNKLIDFFESYTSMVEFIGNGYCLKNWVQVNQIWKHIAKDQKMEFALQLLSDHQNIFSFKKDDFSLFNQLKKSITCTEFEQNRTPLNFTRLFLEILYFLQKDQLNTSDLIDHFMENLSKSELQQIELFELLSNYSFSTDLTKSKNLDKEQLFFKSISEQKSFENLIAYIQNQLFKVKYLFRYKDQDLILMYFDFMIRNPSDYLLPKMIVLQKDYRFIQKLFIHQRQLWIEQKEAFENKINSFDRDVIFEFLKQLSSQDAIFHQNKEYKEINRYIAQLMSEKFSLFNFERDPKKLNENVFLREMKKISLDAEEIDDIFNQFFVKKVKHDLINKTGKYLINLDLLKWIDLYPSQSQLPHPQVLNVLKNQISDCSIDECESEKYRLLKAKLKNPPYITTLKTIEMLSIQIDKILRFKRIIKSLSIMLCIGCTFFFGYPYLMTYLEKDQLDKIKQDLIQVQKKMMDQISHIKIKDHIPKDFDTKIQTKINEIIGNDQKKDTQKSSTNHVAKKNKAVEICPENHMAFFANLLLNCTNQSCRMQSNELFDQKKFYQMYQESETKINFLFDQNEDKPIKEIWKEKEFELLSNLTTMSAIPRNVLMFVISLHQNNPKLAQKRTQKVLSQIKKLFNDQQEKTKITYLIEASINTIGSKLSIDDAQKELFFRTADGNYFTSKKKYENKNLDDYVSEALSIQTYPCWQEFCTYLTTQKQYSISCKQIKTVPQICKPFCDSKISPPKLFDQP